MSKEPHQYLLDNYLYGEPIPEGLIFEFYDGTKSNSKDIYKDLFDTYRYHSVNIRPPSYDDEQFLHVCLDKCKDYYKTSMYIAETYARVYQNHVMVYLSRWEDDIQQTMSLIRNSVPEMDFQDNGSSWNILYPSGGSLVIPKMISQNTIYDVDVLVSINGDSSLAKYDQRDRLGNISKVVSLLFNNEPYYLDGNIQYLNKIHLGLLSGSILVYDHNLKNEPKLHVRRGVEDRIPVTYQHEYPCAIPLDKMNLALDRYKKYYRALDGVRYCNGSDCDIYNRLKDLMYYGC